MLTLGHQQSPENSVCSLLLSHRIKCCGCAVFICNLVLGDEQGPGVSPVEPPGHVMAAVVGWGCQRTSCALWEGDIPMVVKWQVLLWKD